MSWNLDDLLTAYVSAFETLDPDTVTPFYHLPCTFIRPGALLVAADTGTMRAVVSGLMENAWSQGYQRTKILGGGMTQLAADLAWFSGTFVRFDAASEEIARFGFTYIVRNEGGRWKIAVAMAHDVPAQQSGNAEGHP